MHILDSQSPDDRDANTRKVVERIELSLDTEDLGTTRRESTGEICITLDPPWVKMLKEIKRKS